jgi:hypothetical protein
MTSPKYAFLIQLDKEDADIDNEPFYPNQFFHSCSDRPSNRMYEDWERKRAKNQIDHYEMKNLLVQRVEAVSKTSKENSNERMVEVNCDKRIQNRSS